MIDKEFLMIPGPTPLPPRVVAAMTNPMINHRGPKFKKIFLESIEILKKILNTDGELYMFGSSGSGAMELAVENFSKKGDKVLVVDTGFFGQRFYEICLSFERDPIRLQIPWGKSVKDDEILEILKKESDIKTIFITHNETSTGIINNIEKISKKIKEVSDALIVVDAVSSIGISKIDMLNWGIDVVVAASQKGLMAPPGIGIVALNKRALDFALKNERGSYYFSVKELKKRHDLGQPFTTFPVSNLFGLREALNLLLEEGLENVYKRHEGFKYLLRNSIKETNLNLLANDEDSSPCVTAVLLPEKINGDDFVKRVRERYNIELAGMFGDYKGKGFRIGHMGYMNSNDLLVTIAGIECALKDFGHSFNFGEATKKFLELRREIDI
ncbi:MAG: alanine--glyoxylate aminotransferase family protein [Caldisericia bacterium]|nr:alanine--glyoxylate aminotransferase family protein [Caldisericia bacterium]